MAIHRILALVGAALLVVGSVLPWMSLGTIVGPVAVRGIAGPGQYTILIGGILLLVAVLWKGRPAKLYSLAGLVLALVALLITGYNAITTTIFAADPPLGTLYARVGLGIYTVIIGSVVAAFGLSRRVAVAEPGAPDISIDTTDVADEEADAPV